LHNLIDGTDIYQALITDQTAMTSVGSLDKLLIADSDLTAADAPRSVTVNELFEDALTLSTYTNVQATNSFYTNATGNYTRSTGATITNGTITNLTSSTGSITIGTIPTLTAGTTTSTAANITNGTVQTLTASTGTIGTFNSTTGTIATLNSTTGTVATLNSTTGTIGNLSTTIAGDFTISQGTGTLGTSGVVAGTYGTNTSAVRLDIDSKGRITTVSTSAISTTPADGSITAAKLDGAQTGSAPIFGTRAWVNFNGKGTVGTNASGNVSSITDNAVGIYTVNFTTSLPDGNYSVSGFSVALDVGNATGASMVTLHPSGTSTFLPSVKTSAAVKIITGNSNTGTPTDSGDISITIVR
jgi:hypothetical protein